MDEQPIVLQPFVIKDGQTILGPELPTDPHEFIGFLIDYQTRSLIVMLYDQAMMSHQEGTVPCVVLQEKDITRVIGGFQQALQHLRVLPVPPSEAQ